VNLQVVTTEVMAGMEEMGDTAEMAVVIESLRVPLCNLFEDPHRVMESMENLSVRGPMQ
jgi:hypothetical protein